jgi:hypothetical protein
MTMMVIDNLSGLLHYTYNRTMSARSRLSAVASGKGSRVVQAATCEDDEGGNSAISFF